MRTTMLRRIRKHLPRRLAQRDEGSLMILAGIVITLAFITTSLTLAQVSTLEREAAAEKPTPMTGEWRFLHERLATNLNVSISEETTLDSFKSDTFPRIAATFRNVQEEKGYDTVIRLSGAGYPDEEHNLTDGVNYVKAYTRAGMTVSNETIDLHNDGVIVDSTCPISGAPGGECIVGVYLYVRLADTTTTLEETILFRVNWPQS